MVQLTVPYPFDSETFVIFKEGIWNDPATNVYINELMDFCYLHPRKSVDYKNYISRRECLSLYDYDADLISMKSRFEKVSPYLLTAKTLLEIGGSDGAFISLVKDRNKDIRITSIDSDEGTLSERVKYSDFNFGDIQDVVSQGLSFDIVCLFHVFEHILKPEKFLSAVKRVIQSKSIIIIEVPSLSDPLLNLYKSEAYKDFYFYSDHPFIYSHTSIERIMKANGFKAQKIIPHQRYGLDNHLQWLASGKPGGSNEYAAITLELDKPYKVNLERKGYTDSVIWVGRLK